MNKNGTVVGRTRVPSAVGITMVASAKLSREAAWLCSDLVDDVVPNGGSKSIGVRIVLALSGSGSGVFCWRLLRLSRCLVVAASSVDEADSDSADDEPCSCADRCTANTSRSNNSSSKDIGTTGASSPSGGSGWISARE